MEASSQLSDKTAALRRQLLDWYDRHRRDLPWRKTGDPYAIWISEIMLQQTRVAVVVERYGAFLERFPTLASLAKAREEDVLALWSGLGYYRRARMLHRAAQLIATQHQGTMPQTAQALRLLPGIGPYTAAAVASIAYGEAVAVVDGNVERVICRLEGWEGSSKTSSELRLNVEKVATRLLDFARPGDFNQAMMELGATACLPRNPQCMACPIANSCKTRGEHKTAPRKPMRSAAIGHALAVRSVGRRAGGRDEVLLERRPDLLTVMPGLWELPVLRESQVPMPELRMTVRHAIMQVNYVVSIRSVAEKDLERLTENGSERRWVPLDEAGAMPLTGLARKVLNRARLLVSKELTRAAAARETGCELPKKWHNFSTSRKRFGTSRGQDLV